MSTGLQFLLTESYYWAHFRARKIFKHATIFKIIGDAQKHNTLLHQPHQVTIPTLSTATLKQKLLSEQPLYINFACDVCDVIEYYVSDAIIIYKTHDSTV